MRSSLIYFVIALSISVVLSVGYGIWYSMVSNESARAASLQDEISAAHTTLDRVTAARATLSEIAGDEEKVQSYFIPESGTVTLINVLEASGLAEKATVSVTSVSKGGTPKRPTLLIGLTVKGTFDAVMRTVGSIEYAPYDVSLPMLSVGQDAKNSWHADLNLIVGSTQTKTATSTP